MFRLEGDVLYVDLPQGRTQDELVESAKEEIRKMIKDGVFFGKDVKLNGRLTTGMALMLGHELAHVCKSVSVFDPKENEYILCVSH